LKSRDSNKMRRGSLISKRDTKKRLTLLKLKYRRHRESLMRFLKRASLSVSETWKLKRTPAEISREK
jgi:hypothetical protein